MSQIPVSLSNEMALALAAQPKLRIEDARTTDFDCCDFSGKQL